MNTSTFTDPLEIAMSDAVNNYGNAIIAHIEQQLKPLKQEIADLQKQIAQLKADQAKTETDHG